MTFHSLIPSRSVFRAPLAHPGLRAFWPAEMDRFFDEALGNVPAAQAEQGFTPRIDVSESDEAYVVRADLPGVEEKDIQISLEEGVLSIQGKLESEQEEERKGLRYAERVRGSFERRIELPGELDETKVSASYKQGVLTVTLPKQPAPKPQVRSIPISS
jgi:HSP20 family protein